MKSATKGFRETKTCSCTGEATTCRGSLSREQAQRLERGFMCVQNLRVSTTTLQEHLVTSLALKSTSAESTARRSGNVISAQRNTLFSLTGKPTQKSVVQGNTNVTVVPFFQGSYTSKTSTSYYIFFYVLLLYIFYYAYLCLKFDSAI